MANSVAMKLGAIVHTAQQTLENNLPALWDELFGNNETIIQERLESIQENLTTMVNEMVQEEQATKREYTTKYEELLNEAETLEKELAINVPRRDVKKEPMCVRIKTLEQDLEAHRIVRRERMAALETLQREESEICATLQEQCTYADFTSVPSEAKLSEIKKHITSLKSTLKARQTQYAKLRKQVLNKWSTLELEPGDNFEVQVESNDLELLLGVENLTKLEAVVKKLDETEAKMLEELEVLRYKLSTLWNRLNTDSRERERFLTVNSRCCVATMNAFKEQIEVCTALKLTRIKEIVGSIRSELQDWWDRAHFGQEQRNLFVAFSLEDDITEEVLEKHEKEVENVKQYLEENRETIALLEQRFALWEEMVVLEDKANDKDRLFSNRGGQLLREEKKRKFIQKELPKLEKLLDRMFDAYEERTGEAFMFDGEDARQVIASQWEGRNKTKENVKQAKKNVVATTAARGRFLAPSGNLTRHQTPDRTLKRKGEVTPLVENKRRLIGGATHTEAEKTKMPAVSKVIGVSRKHESGQASPTPSLPSYSMFQNQLDNGVALNSTYNSKSSQSSTDSKVTRSTPVPGRPKLPARSRLLSPKVRSKLPAPSTRTPITPAGATFTRSRSQLTMNLGNTLTRSRSHANLTPASNTNLRRSRSQAQLTTPKHKPLPFIF